MAVTFAPSSSNAELADRRWSTRLWRWIRRRRADSPTVYDAFISYSHAKDKAVAAALQSVVQKLGKPWYRRRALRVFRDDTSLSAAPELWFAIEQSLARSRYLILLASPEAAASIWVNKEIEYWQSNKGPDTLLIAVTDGNPRWDEAAQGFAATQPPLFPPALAGRLRQEPKWVDLCAYRDRADPNDGRFIELGADFAAAIRGIPKEDLLSQEVRQQRRALTLAWSAAACLVVLVLAAMWGWISAVQQKHEAQAQRDRAEAALQQADRNYATALRGGSNVVDIVRGMVYAGTLPTQSAEKLLSVSRKTVGQLEDERASEDVLEVQWRLLDTLSLAYLDVPGEGNLDTAKKLNALATRLVTERPDNASYRQHLVESKIRLADASEVHGDLDSALFNFRAALDQAMKLIDADRDNGDRQRSLGYIHGRIGDVLRSTGHPQEARQEYREYLRLTSALALRPNPKPDWIRGLAIAHEKIGDILRDLDQLGPALDAYADYQKAASALVAMEARNAPNVTWRMDLWISYERIGDVLLEEGQNEQALDNFERFRKGAEEAAILDPDQGQWQRFLANSYIKLGDAFTAQGRFKEALEQEDQALKIYQRLISNDRTRAMWRRNLALVHQRRGAILVAMSNFSAATAEFKACEDVEASDAAIDPQLIKPRLLNKECKDDIEDSEKKRQNSGRGAPAISASQ